MSVFRLETFTPGSGPFQARQGDLQRSLEAARAEAYQAGFLDGQAAATEQVLQDDARLSSALVEAVSDARLTNEAARRHVAATLAPMIEALCAAIAPALADAGIAAEVARLVERAVEAAPQARPRLRCAPEVVANVTAVLAGRCADAAVEEAPELLPREAQIFWDQGYDHIDLDACIAQVAACIASHLQPKSEAPTDDPN